MISEFVISGDLPISAGMYLLLRISITLLRRTAEATENRTFGKQADGIDSHDERLLISSKASQESPPTTWIVIRSAEDPSVPKVGRLSFLPRQSSIQLKVVGHGGFQLFRFHIREVDQNFIATLSGRI